MGQWGEIKTESFPIWNLHLLPLGQGKMLAKLASTKTDHSFLCKWRIRSHEGQQVTKPTNLKQTVTWSSYFSGILPHGCGTIHKRCSWEWNRPDSMSFLPSPPLGVRRQGREQATWGHRNSAAPTIQNPLCFFQIKPTSPHKIQVRQEIRHQEWQCPVGWTYSVLEHSGLC